ncbi:class I SAM-dependent methyltransferase [Altererythrobacter fulvus]|uniref:class I SAM-dependent methyltransferase n=1 Tax=Caenibius fulvus TaxID=2126012 RepID=UPI003017502D
MNSMNSDAWKGFLGRKWAASWAMTDRTFGGLTERMEQLCEAAPMTRMLDAGCGAGEFAIRLAARHPGLQAIGVDISEELIEEARSRAAGVADVGFICDDVARFRPDDGALFDLIVARHVVMFFDDPQAVLGHLASLTEGGGRLIFSCFRSNEENGWIADILALLPERFQVRLRAGQPGPLAFADRQWVEHLLARSGWTQAVFEPFDYGMAVGAGSDPLDDAVSYLLNIGPASFAAAEFDAQERSEFVQRLRTLLSGYLVGDRVLLPAATWLVSAVAK